MAELEAHAYYSTFSGLQECVHESFKQVFHNARLVLAVVVLTLATMVLLDRIKSQ